jgi:hypothetical protein
VAGTSRESTAKRDGYKILTDQDLLNGVEGRARQLEAERAGHLLYLAEAEALGDDAAVEAASEEIAKLEKRLAVVHGKRDALKSNMPKADAATKATT